MKALVRLRNAPGAQTKRSTGTSRNILIYGPITSVADFTATYRS